jgi:hypothetical protein
MNLKNSKNLLLIGIFILIIAVTFVYLTHKTSDESISFINIEQDNGTIINSITVQNNVLSNFFNSLYESQISNINSKYNEGTISSEEKDKQLNAVIKNSVLTNVTLNKLTNTKRDIFTGNIYKQDILVHNNSLGDINSDIKNEFNDTLYGY